MERDTKAERQTERVNNLQIEPLTKIGL